MLLRSLPTRHVGVMFGVRWLDRHNSMCFWNDYTFIWQEHNRKQNRQIGNGYKALM